jgi:hypothetical protein
MHPNSSTVPQPPSECALLRTTTRAAERRRRRRANKLKLWRARFAEAERCILLLITEAGWEATR